MLLTYTLRAIYAETRIEGFNRFCSIEININNSNQWVTTSASASEVRDNIETNNPVLIACMLSCFYFFQFPAINMLLHKYTMDKTKHYHQCTAELLASFVFHSSAWPGL